jgi:hypothetical protein
MPPPARVYARAVYAGSMARTPTSRLPSSDASMLPWLTSGAIRAVGR